MAQQTKLGKANTTATRNKEGLLQVTFHDTIIVKELNGLVELNTGGWKTATTKTRMNQASSQFSLGYHVRQTNNNWYVDLVGDVIPFDGDVISFTVQKEN